MAVTLDIVVKCVHRPSRVPGCAHDDLRPSATTASRTGGSALTWLAGASRTTRKSTRPRTTPRPADSLNAVLQPRVASAADIGTAAAIAPSCPNMPVACVTSGLRAGANHDAT